MFDPITITPDQPIAGPFAIEHVITLEGDGFVVVRRPPFEDGREELYFVPSDPDDSELVCTYVVALLNALAARHPSIVALQARS